MMRLGTTFVLAATLFSGAAMASEQSDLLAVFNQYVELFNKGDVKAAELCSAQAVIIDEFPPHVWSGPNACLTWMADYDKDATKNGITDGHVTPGKPTVVDLSGDRAYIVVPSDYDFKLKGKPVKEKAASFTMAFQKTPQGWRIIGWSWSKN